MGRASRNRTGGRIETDGTGEGTPIGCAPPPPGVRTRITVCEKTRLVSCRVSDKRDDCNNITALQRERKSNATNDNGGGFERNSIRPIEFCLVQTPPSEKLSVVIELKKKKKN